MEIKVHKHNFKPEGRSASYKNTGQHIKLQNTFLGCHEDLDATLKKRWGPSLSKYANYC